MGCCWIVVGMGDDLCAQIPGLHPHALRHATASLLSAAGVRLEDIADTLGHRSVTITADIYRHTITPTRTAHLTALDNLAPPEPPDGQHQARAASWRPTRRPPRSHAIDTNSR
jgi:hypothetical protein